MHPTIERLLSHAARHVQLLAALTPREAASERARLADELRAGRPLHPRWSYAPASHDELRRALAAVEHALAVEPPTPRGAAALARARELDLEAELCEAAGTAEVTRLARVRFPEPPAEAAREASALAAAWLAEPEVEAEGEAIASDSADPRSLLSRLRAEVGRLRLPFSVVVHASLAPLAATGDGFILVAPGRRVFEADVTRTVLHEIEGHALPRVRAASAPHPLFRIGTAAGIDHQEGRAVLLEERAGLLGPRRRRQLAARHRAVEAMLGGATFGEVATSLARDHGLGEVDAVVLAERAFRGGDGTRPGLGRERVYLESFVRVRAHLAARPGDEPVLASGQIALDAIDALAPLLPPRPACR